MKDPRHATLTHGECEEAWDNAQRQMSDGQRLLGETLLAAYYRDAVARQIYRSIYVELESGRPTHELVDRIGYLVMTAVGLCAALAQPAADRLAGLRRISADGEAILGLGDEAPREFLRQLFTSAGISGRFDPRPAREQALELIGA